MLSTRMRESLLRRARRLGATAREGDTATGQRGDGATGSPALEPPAGWIRSAEGYLLLSPPLPTLPADEAGVRARLASASAALVGRPDGLAVIDIETTGLSGVPLFLVGVLSLGPEGARIDQHFARRPGEEETLLEGFLRQVCRFEGLVTFNGARFDLPFIEARAAYHRLPRVLPGGHLDLLPLARARWGAALPDCRLTTLEARVLGRPRGDDVPGSAVPALYADFQRTGDWHRVAPILRHNALDLIATAELLPLLADER